MIPVFQDIIDQDKGNCLQAAIASLLELPLGDVPNFIELDKDDWFRSYYKFLQEHGYEHMATINNPVTYGMKKNRFDELKREPGVDGYFWAAVYSPKFWGSARKPPTSHAVIINNDFEIVHPVNKEYIGMKQFPDHERIGYNGIIYISLIERIKDEL